MKLTEITLPESITEIGDSAFVGCGFKTIIIPSNVIKLQPKCFSGCKSLTNIIIPDNVTGIGSDAFAHCTNLTTVIIGKNIKTIATITFRECVSLTDITIPDSVTVIGDDAFYNCKSLNNIKFNGTKEQWENIRKISTWKRNANVTTITCTDGIINLE